MSRALPAMLTLALLLAIVAGGCVRFGFGVSADGPISDGGDDVLGVDSGVKLDRDQLGGDSTLHDGSVDAPEDVSSLLDGITDGAGADSAAADGSIGGLLHSWSLGFGAIQSDTAYGLVVDGSGNVTISGFFNGSVDFGGGALASAGSHDIFVASYDASGAHRWSRRFGGAGVDLAVGAAVDDSGNITLVGYAESSLDFGGSLLPNAGSYDVFVASLDSSGAHRWSKSFGTAAGELGYGVGTNASGDVIVTGSFENTVSFGGASLTSAGDRDVFVAYFDANGAHQKSSRFGGAGDDRGRALGVDDAGNVTVNGFFNGSVSFGPTPIASAGCSDIFVASYDSNGLHRWSKGMGTAQCDYPEDLAVDGAGNVAVTGFFQNPGDMSLPFDPGDKDIFVNSYDSSGSLRWSKVMGSSGDDSGNGVAIDGAGNIIVVGSFEGTVDLEGIPLSSAGATDIFVAVYDSDGVHRWSERFGGSMADGANAVEWGPDGTSIVVGDYSGSVDFGGGPLPGVNADIFVLQLAPSP